MATQQAPIFPFQEPIAATGTLLVTPRWRRWLLNLREAVDLTPTSIPVAPVLNAAGALPVTDMSSGALNAGIYSVSWYLSIVTTEPASSVQVTIAWVDLTVPKSYQAPIVDGSIANMVQVNQKITFYADAGTPITYAVAYVGATMVYSFRPVLQSVSTS